MHHELKKTYFVALRDAWMIFDPVVLEEVKDTLRLNGSDNDDIAARMYYDFDYFRQRVPRRVPPPSIHYWRVRRVFELFGPIEDSKSKQRFGSGGALTAGNGLSGVGGGSRSVAKFLGRQVEPLSERAGTLRIEFVGEEKTGTSEFVSGC